MTWTPANLTGSCFENLDISSCQQSFIHFLIFLMQYLGFSNDDRFEKQEIENKFDFIIVGAGSAGCVVANRLSEIKNWKILLLEAGDEEPLITDMPGSTGLLPGSSVDYNYVFQLGEICKGNPSSCIVPRGKVMGGSSSINGMAYVRGNKLDFDEWVNDYGNPGWSWNEVLPYFKKSEDLQDKIPSANPEDHSTGGYLGVSLPAQDSSIDVLIDSWKELGYKEVDYNSGNQVGISKMQFTIKNGVRQSTNAAFIRPIRGKRSNLIIRPNSHVTKIIIDSNNKKAIGVEYVQTMGSKTINKKAFTKKELIVSGGTVNSAKLLMLSGIGPVNELKKAGVKMIFDLPVGRNLQEHVGSIPIILQRLNGVPAPFEPFTDKGHDVEQWLANGTGPMRTSGVFGVAIFFNTSYETRLNVPDIQVTILNSFSAKESNGLNATYNVWPYYNQLTVIPALIAPRSRGWIELNKTDPIWGNPLIYPNFYNNSQDIEVLLEAIAQTKKFTETQVFKQSNLTVSTPSVPKCDKYSFDEVEKYYECISRNYLQAIYHPVGTCRMGPNGHPQAVVDPRLRVYGVKGLRVIDASIMPKIIRGNTNAVAIMIGEKGSDLIKEDWL